MDSCSNEIWKTTLCREDARAIAVDLFAEETVNMPHHIREDMVVLPQLALGVARARNVAKQLSRGKLERWDQGNKNETFIALVEGKVCCGIPQGPNEV